MRSFLRLKRANYSDLKGFTFDLYLSLYYTVRKTSKVKPFKSLEFAVFSGRTTIYNISGKKMSVPTFYKRIHRIISSHNLWGPPVEFVCARNVWFSGAMSNCVLCNGVFIVIFFEIMYDKAVIRLWRISGIIKVSVSVINLGIYRSLRMEPMHPSVKNKNMIIWQV